MSDKLYSLCYDDGKIFGVGMAPEGTPWDILWKKSSSTAPITLRLTKPGFPDLLASNIVGLFFSQKTRQIIDEMLRPRQSVEWTTLTITGPDGESRPYYMLRFLADEDTLDEEQTLYADRKNNVIVRPVFSRAKISDFHIFSLPGESVRLYVDDEFKKALKSQHCVGIKLEPARVS